MKNKNAVRIATQVLFIAAISIVSNIVFEKVKEKMAEKKAS